MNDELRKISSQILSGIQGANTATQGVSQTVSDFARSANVDVLNRGFGGLGAVAQKAADEEEKAAEAARQAQMQAIQDKLNPAKYRAAKDREDGGYSFYDPDGNQIGIDRYAAVTGRNPAEILSDSDNPFDLQFVNDYKNTRQVIEAAQNGDTDTLDTFKASNGDVGKMTPEELMRQLIKKYPHIYGNGQYKDSYKSNNNPLIRYNLGGSLGGGSSSSSGTRNWMQ